MEMVRFKDRAEGGRELADALKEYAGADGVVFGLPRGGVITAREVAERLSLPLDLLIARKLGHPLNPEYAIGAVTDTGEVVLDEEAVAEVSPAYLDAEVARRLQEARERRTKYLGDRQPVPVEGKIAIVVDDGIATGYTMKAAVTALRKRNPAVVVVAAPVGPRHALSELAAIADRVVIPHTPPGFYAIGAHYDEFAPVADDEVVAAMSEFAER